MKTNIVFICFAMLSLIDAYSTYMVTGKKKYWAERNPLARWLFKSLGVIPGIVIIKMISFLSMFYLITLDIIPERKLVFVLIILCLFYFFIILHNLKNKKTKHEIH